MLTKWLYILLVLTKSINSITVITKPEITVTLGSNTPVVLNCTYVTEKRIKTIIWKKFINDAYKDLAEYSTDGSDPVYSNDGIYLRNRSDLINPGNGSTSAILIIKDVKCEDDGRYQCFIKYLDGALEKATSETTVFLQVSAEQPTSFFLFTNGTLKEKDEVNLFCSANVGNPDGFVAIWKLNKFSNKPVLLNKSSSVDKKTEDCTAIAHLSITYTVSRDDHGATFRCTSQNRQTEEPVSNKVTTAIDVYYGPSNVTIKTSPSHLDLFIGANVNLTCSSDGNPAPTFKWKFNSSDVRKDERHSLTRDNRTLILKNMVYNDSGIYSCLASNLINGETQKMSSNLSLKVQKRVVVPIYQLTCGENPCGITESCTDRNGRAVCTTNIWSFISFLFIFITIVFMVTTAILCIKQQRDQIRSFLSRGNIVKLGVHHSQESDTGHAEYEVLNNAGTMNAPGTTENTRYEVLNTASKLRERNTTNTEYEALQRETKVSGERDVENQRYEVLNRTEQTKDNMNAGYEVLDKRGESNVYEKIDAEIKAMKI